MLAYLRKGETCSDLACGFHIGTSTVYRYVREALTRPAALAPALAQAMEVARGKAFVILDGTLLGIDRVGMVGGRDRPCCSGKHKCHGVDARVIAGPAGRLVWISPALPGARHDVGAAREHGVIDALTRAGVTAIADTAYQGGGLMIRVPQRRRRVDPDTGRYRRLSAARRDADPAQDPLQPRPGLRARCRSSDPHDRQHLIRLAKPHFVRRHHGDVLDRPLGELLDRRQVGWPAMCPTTARATG